MSIPLSKGLLARTGAVLLMGAALLAAGPAAARVLEVVTSFSILGDLVSEVGGDRVHATSLIGRDQDGHVFQPRPSELARLKQADLVVVNGLGFEGWLTRLLQSAGYGGPVVVASTGVAPRDGDGHSHNDDHGHGHGHSHGGAIVAPDPHAWQDPQRVAVYVDNIAEALAGADPEHAAGYRERAAAYRQRLTELDGWIRSELSGLPETRRTVVTPHAAMAYYGDRYGLSFLAAQGPSAASEPGARELAGLVRQIRDSGSLAIFQESPGTPALLRQLSRETGVPLRGRLYSDTLSPADGPAASYLDMMRYNTQQLRSALEAGGKP